MGTFQDFTCLITRFKEGDNVNYSERRRATRAVCQIYNNVVGTHFCIEPYQMQYIEDLTKDVFYLPLRSMFHLHCENVDRLIINYNPYYCIEGKTAQDCVYKAMVSSQHNPESFKVIAVSIKGEKPIYVSNDIIFDENGKLLFGLFAKCHKEKKHTILDEDTTTVYVDSIIAKMDSRVYTENTEASKVITKYIIPNIFKECIAPEWACCKSKTDTLITTMEVGDFSNLIQKPIAPSIAEYSNEATRQMLKDNIDLFV